MYNNIALTNGSYYRLEQGSYAVADVMAGYQVNKHLDLQVNVNNLFDRTYYSAIGTRTNLGLHRHLRQPAQFWPDGEVQLLTVEAHGYPLE